MNNTIEKKKRIGALDVFIILLVVSCVLFLALRFIDLGGSDVNESAILDDYTVSFKVSDIRDSSAKNYLEPGTNFYLKETDTLFGTLLDGITISDAQEYHEMPDGKVVSTRNTATGSLYRVDVEGSFTVQGRLDQNGTLLLDGNKYIGLNKEISIYSKYLSIQIQITGIIN